MEGAVGSVNARKIAAEIENVPTKGSLRQLNQRVISCEYFMLKEHPPPLDV